MDRCRAGAGNQLFDGGRLRRAELALTTPAGRTSLFVGLLLKQDFGIRDSWCDGSLPRHKINRTLKEAQRGR